MENHKEDILKKFLRDTFSDYEPEPTDTSWATIFSAIQPNRPTLWGKSKPWISSGLVVIISTLLWYSSADVGANNSEITLNTERVRKPIEIFKSEKSELTALLFTNKSPQSNNSQTEVKNIQIANNLRIIPLKNPQRIYIVSDSNETIVNNDTPNEELAKHPKVEHPSGIEVTDNLKSEPAPWLVSSSSTRAKAKFVDTHANIVGEDTNHGADNLTASTSVRVETVATGEVESGRVETFATGEINTSILEQIRYIRPMESLKNKDFTLSKMVLNPVLITPVINPNREAKPVRQHTYLSMSITPIQTYRILTINNKNVQNVQTSNLFDSERNGWQFDLGVTKPIGNLWNFRANMSYLRMRQWSEYQIGTDEYVLKNNNYNVSNQSTSNTLQAVGQTVTESRNLHMVGLKMDVQKFFKITGKNRYFISTGTQVMYENSQKQGNIFLNVSVGFQHIVSPTTFITIEPISSYSINNFNDSKSLLQTNGYNLGLKMGVSFKVK